MKSKLIIIFLILALGGGLFYYFNFKKPPASETLNQEQNKGQAKETAVVPPPADDFIKQSAREMVDPTGETKKNLEKELAISLASSAPAPNMGEAAKCVEQKAGTFGCYEDYYRAVVKSQGVAAAFADLKSRYPNNSYIQSQCHPITHIIGQEATNLYVEVGLAYTKGDSFCWSGYYHGVMEGIVGKISRAELAGKFNDICSSVPGKASYSFDYYNCVHGLGHGVMAINNTELFESLKFCDNLSGSWEQSSCYSGVFMENVIVDNKNHFTKYLKPEEPLYPCTAVEDKYKGTCYLMQTSYMLKVTGGGFTKVFELCGQAGESYVATCYQSLGRDASGRSVSNAAVTKTTCELGKSFEARSNCIIGAVKDFISYYHSDVQAKELCNSLDADLQSICSSTAESYYKSF